MSNKTTREDLLEQVKANKESLENAKNINELGILDVEYRLDQDLDLKNIIVTLTTGGPHIELNLAKYRIDGYWSGATVDYPIFEGEKEARNMIDQLWNLYEQQYKPCLLT